MERVFRVLLATTFPFVFVGCGTIAWNVPMSRMDSPEINATPESVSTAQFGAGGQQVAVVQSDVSIRPFDPNVGTAWDSATPSLFAQLRFARQKNYEISFGGHSVLGPFNAELKYLFFGPDRKDAKTGDNSLAVTGALQFDWISRSGDQNGLFGRGGYRWRANLTETNTDFAIIYGHRFSDAFLVYGGPFVIFIKYSGTIDQDASDDGRSGASHLSLDGSGRVRGVNVAFQFENNGLSERTQKQTSSWTIEYVHSIVELTRAISVEGNYAGFSYTTYY